LLSVEHRCEMFFKRAEKLRVDDSIRSSLLTLRRAGKVGNLADVVIVYVISSFVIIPSFI
jgi:hypothetical protein